MPSGSFSKKARYTDSLTNKKNCGGNKKAGLAPRATGPVEYRNSALNKQGVNFKIHQAGLPCPENYSNNPGGQCSGGVGALASTRNRGCSGLGNNGNSGTINNARGVAFFLGEPDPNATPVFLKGTSPNLFPISLVAFDINNNGNMIGGVLSNFEDFTGFSVYWDSFNSNPIILKDDNGDPNTLIFVLKPSINDNKKIVGSIGDILTGTLFPVFWDSPSSNAIKLKNNAGIIVRGFATHINNSNNIVGNIDDGTGNGIPVFWTDSGSNATPLNLGGIGANGNANSINDGELNKSIVGVINNQPVIWKNSGSAPSILLNTVGVVTNGDANDINNSGEIVGKIIDGVERPVYWENGISNATILKDANGADAIGVALSINIHGNIVGNIDVGGETKSAYWADKDSNAQIFDLSRTINGAPEPVPVIIYNINDNRQLVGGDTLDI